MSIGNLNMFLTTVKCHLKSDYTLLIFTLLNLELLKIVCYLIVTKRANAFVGILLEKMFRHIQLIVTVVFS